MDSELKELADNIKNRGRDGPCPLYKETAPEFAMPKFPIEKKEMEQHILEHIRSRTTLDLISPADANAPNELGSLNSHPQQRNTLPTRRPHSPEGILRVNKNGKEADRKAAMRKSDPVTFITDDSHQSERSQSQMALGQTQQISSGVDTSSDPYGTSYDELSETAAQGSGSINYASADALTNSMHRMVVGSYPHGASGESASMTPNHAGLGNSMDLPPLILEEDDALTATVEFERVQISGHATLELPVDEMNMAAKALIESLLLRQRYLHMSVQSFHQTTARYLKIINHGSMRQLEKQERFFKSVQLPDADYPINPPETTGNPFEVTDIPEPMAVKFEFRQGVMHVLPPDEIPTSSDDDQATTSAPCLEFSVPSLATFLSDYESIRTLVADGPLKSYCYRRLAFLESKFSLHSLLNETRESLEQKRVAHRDFYNVRKVDTHVHAAACMNQKHLLRFIKKTIKTQANEEVCLDPETRKPLTMQQLIGELNVTAYDLNTDNLDVHADRNLFHRFDRFNAKYNPIGQSQLREVFLKTDNYIGGRFFGHVLKEVFADLDESKYQNAEPRLSIYGRWIDEWDNLAKWAVNCKVYSDNVRWLIQVPRLYDVYHAKGSMKCFQDIITNVFKPLFEVTADPSSHPELHSFLQFVTGFDSVDDESKSDHIVFNMSTPTPENYTLEENPPYSYYIYYMYANLSQLNQFRKLRGMHTFSLRPHCGEAGNLHHLITTFLLAESINHGLSLRKAPVLQYLYYLAQVGIAMSPLSNNSLFLDYHRNPMNRYMCRGLNISLSTDDPLQFHFTKEPLIEEYSIAAQVWKLSPADMCELARNSVLQSGFSHEVKSYWLGPYYEQEGVIGNDITRTNVPNIRLAYRFETLTQELRTLLVRRSTGSASTPVSPSSTGHHSPVRRIPMGKSVRFPK